MNSDNQDSGMVELTKPTQVLGLPSKTAAVLCYVPICAINLISSIIFYKTEPNTNKFLRFHAMQSLIMCGAFIAISLSLWVITFILGLIPIIGWMMGIVTSLASFALSIVFIWKSISCMIDANNGGMTRLPYIGDMAAERI